MTGFAPSETLHRLVKQALDNGVAESVAEAEALFHGYRLGFTIDAVAALDPQHQVALLTGVALGRRVFLGGVSVDGALDVPLLAPLPLGNTLADAVKALGAVASPEVGSTPLVVIGNEPRPRRDGFQIRAAYAGWRGGILPAHSDLAPTGGAAAMPLAAILAAALAVNEAYLHVSCTTGAAGRRVVGLSLWHPSSDADWLVTPADEPELRYLPARLWLIGLGHLGQAYLWGLSLLPYPDPAGLSLLLQDVDLITPSTESTSILTDATLVGQKKTRAMASWAERRGFATAIHERLFDGTFRRQASEPTVALCGLDNALGRRFLDQVGFDFVVEAGLGRGHRDFRTMRLHTLPGTRAAASIWTATGAREEVSDRAAYQKMVMDGELDRCGITLLAGKAVGAAFVGAVAACLALAEVLRLLHGGPLHQLVELDLQSIEHRTVVLQTANFSRLNPGYVMAYGTPACRGALPTPAMAAVSMARSRAIAS